jgi:hypothetical protein
MSNCDFVAAKSLIALAASRLALRAPALRAATALTRPTRSAQRLPSGRHAVPTAVTVGPNNVIDYAKREHLRKPFLADAGSCPGNYSGMEEATGAPSSFADWGSEAAAGFRSRRGRYREPTPVIPHYAPFASYKAARERKCAHNRERNHGNLHLARELHRPRNP